MNALPLFAGKVAGDLASLPSDYDNYVFAGRGCESGCRQSLIILVLMVKCFSKLAIGMQELYC